MTAPALPEPIGQILGKRARGDGVGDEVFATFRDGFEPEGGERLYTESQVVALLADADAPTSREASERRVVCAAIRASDGRLLLGIRHYSRDMHEQLARRDDRNRFQGLRDENQGFVDQSGAFMSREEAYEVALAAGQIAHPEACGQGLNGPKLYSEGLY